MNFEGHVFYTSDKLAMIIDGPNFHAVAKALDLEVDFRALREAFRSRSRLVRAIYFTTVIEDAEHAPLRPLLDWLDYNGFMTRTKPARDFTDAQGRRRVKGSMDV